MDLCLAEDELLELVQGGRPLGDDPQVEAHLADCPSCSGLLATLLAGAPGRAPAGRGRLVGRTLGPYRLDGLIGAGAMGEVYRAWDARLSRRVAVKVLAARLAGAPEQARRLETEGRALARIAHPNVVTVHDVGSDAGITFIVSELVEGESLRSLIDRGAVPRELALELGRQLVRGLAAAHGQGIVHRDLKPTNLIVARDGTLKILDFGLAKLAAEVAPPDATGLGAVLGTAGYLSPEQARGEPADHRSDLFAAGAILYELLTGARAFRGATYADRLSSVLRDTPARLDAAALGAWLPSIARCMEKDPARRFQSAQDLAWVLDAGVLEAAPRATPAAGLSRRAFVLGTVATGLGGLALGRLLAPRPALPPGGHDYQDLTFRHGRVLSARFTPDQGSVVYAAAWEEEPPALFTTRIGGGGTRVLELPSADVLAVSRRGDLALSLDHHHREGLHTAGHLALVPLEGGDPRRLGLEVQGADFTPDGAQLAIIRRNGAGFRLELPPGEPLAEVPGWLGGLRVSPDGTRIALLSHPGTDDDRGDVLLVDRASRAVRAVSEGWSSLAGLAWRSDRELWFGAARTGGNLAIWSMRLDTPGAREALVAGATGRLRLHDVAAGGAAVVSNDRRRLRTMVKAPGPGAETDLSLSDTSIVGDLSSDGRRLLVGEFGDVDRAPGCYLRPTAGGRPRHLGPGYPLALSGDGARALAVLFGEPAQLVVMGTSGGVPEPVPLGPIASVSWARWGSGDRLVVGGAARGARQRLWLIRLGAGPAEPVPLTPEGLAGVGHLDAIGGAVAFVAPDGRLLTVAIDSGQVTAIPGAFPDQQVCAWSSGLFVRTSAVPIQIRRVDPASGAARAYATISPPAMGRKGVDALFMSPTAGAYAYSYGEELSRLYLLSAPAAANR